MYVRKSTAVQKIPNIFRAFNLIFPECEWVLGKRETTDLTGVWTGNGMNEWIEGTSRTKDSFSAHCCAYLSQQ